LGFGDGFQQTDIHNDIAGVLLAQGWRAQQKKYG
jgi:hypothetical protein